jgi:PUA-domain protein
MQQIGKREIKELAEKVEKYSITLSKKDNLVVEDDFYYKNKELFLFEYKNHIFPTLKVILGHKEIENAFKKVTVDMGAIRFVIKGADIMRPGIPRWDTGIKKNEPVLIVDESHGKPIAIGISLYSDADYKEQQAGKAIKNIHYVGDVIWHGKEKA